MKGKSLLLTGTILFSLLFVQCQTVFKNNSKVKLTNELDTASYYLGIFYAQNCYNNYIREVNEKAFQMGFQQVMSKDSTIPAEVIIGQFLGQYSSKLYEASVKEDNKEAIEKNENFLEENKKKDNVIELSSGLQYSIIEEGTGPRPAISDKVKVHYIGTFIDGQKFDSSVDRGEPASFYVNGVIKGWTEALQLMPVGSKWMLYVPQGLAYGARGQGQIPPFSTLVFEVELLEIEKN